MKVTMLIPDELLSDIQIEANIKMMNRTQYVVRACREMVSADRMLRSMPDIQAQLNNLSASLVALDEQINKED